MRDLLPFFLLNFILGTMEFVLPIKFSEASASVGLTAIIFSTSSFFSIILDIPAGKLSDRIGRVKLIEISMIILAIAAGILYFSNTIISFFIATSLFGIAYGLNWSPMLAMVGDLANKKNQGSFFGKFFSLTALAEGLAPLFMAAVMLKFRPETPFLIVGVFAILCMLIFTYQRRRNNLGQVHPPREAASNYPYLSSVAMFEKSLAVNLFLVTCAFFVAFFWESVWFSQPLVGFYENSIFDSALIIATFALPTVLFSGLMGKVIDKFGAKLVFLCSTLATVLSFIVFYLNDNLVIKIPMIFIAAIGILGVWMVTDILTVRLHGQHERGEFFGILETVRDVSYLIAPLFIAASYKFIGLNGVFAVNAVLALLLLIWGVKAFSTKGIDKASIPSGN